ncbi:hypothetical protein [Enterococcus sp. CWB-B31]|uniref:hypothetical protein n=1 Tax=Enterococcus sp. CWB-B31 TaxID=2885159 RepID=UPI001E57FD09|nr:hypothetical protein [Enterococcus sp. CWB-B31]MCB5953973.1 hypothetical protein [Enterococcus sp. CWB-B31]
MDKKILTKNKQPVKIISHQDIYLLSDTFEQLISWNEPLNLLENYFSDKDRPVNKQKLAKQYYAYSKLFNVFYTDFKHLLETMDKQISELRSKEKL